MSRQGCAKASRRSTRCDDPARGARTSGHSPPPRRPKGDPVGRLRWTYARMLGALSESIKDHDQDGDDGVVSVAG